MRDAKAQYSQEKAAYENRSPEEIEAANAASAAALAVSHFVAKAYMLLKLLPEAEKIKTENPSSKSQCYNPYCSPGTPSPDFS